MSTLEDAGDSPKGCGGIGKKRRRPGVLVAWVGAGATGREASGSLRRQQPLASCELGFVTPCSKLFHVSLVSLPSSKAKVLTGAAKAPAVTSALLASLPSPGAISQPLESPWASGLRHVLCTSRLLPCCSLCLSPPLPSSAFPSQLLGWARDPLGSSSLHVDSQL